jgi:hypothetical protein
MKWINATDLNAWADRLDSRSRLPEVIRGLIHATAEQPRRVDFRSEESVQLGGWDGLVEVGETHPYLPLGYSGWELGAGKDIKEKADEDYQKRTANPGDLEPSKTTFIFVTPRRWAKKQDWINTRRAEGTWSDVRAYDADDLEQWLELAPAVGAWLAVLIGKYPPGVRSLVNVWDEFSLSTSPSLPKELLVAGREAATKTVGEWLSGPASALNLEADSAAEALAFFASALLSLPDSEAAHWVWRAIVTGDACALRQLASDARPLVLCWFSEDDSAVGVAISNGHHVLMPSGRGRPGTLASDAADVVVKLPRIPREDFVRLMVAAGLAKEKAEYFSRETARSIPVLQRRIPATGRPPIPGWAKPENAQSLTPILLAGSWVESNTSDCGVLQELGGTEYDQIGKTAARWVLESDGPVQRIADEWSLISPLDAWHLLSRTLTGRDLDRFSAAAIRVLSIEDPALELPPKDRWLSGVQEKRIPHSASLRAGLAQTLCLLASIAQRVGISAKEEAHLYVDRVVRGLLGNRPGWKRWYSLSGLLPLLAEASPDSFLRALEDELAKEKPEVMELFAEEGWMAHSAHTGLLWALENLAWFPTYLGRVTVLLGKLARLDPGGKLANRPSKSLREIFLTWRPQTAATSEQRMASIDLLLVRTPEVAWNLLIDLLPKGHDFASPTHEPRWRERDEVKPMTRGEYYKVAGMIIEKAISVAYSEPKRLKDLVPELAWFSPSSREQFLDALTKYVEGRSDKPDDLELWECLRDFCNRHRRFAGADWTLPESELQKIDPVVLRLRPESKIDQSLWLFNDWHPHLPISGIELSEVAAKIEAARRDALATIYSAHGFQGLCSLARAVKHPAFVGHAAADLPVTASFAEELLNATLGQEEHSLRIAGVQFARRLIQIGNSAWYENTLSKIYPKWSATAKADFLIAMSARRSTWKLVSVEEPQVQHLYWSQVQSFELLSENLDEMSEGLSALVQHGRAIEALEVAGHRPSGLSSSLLLRILDEAGRELSLEGPRKVRPMVEYELEQILTSLRSRKDVSETDLVRLEWFYLPLLGRGDAKQTKTLNSLIARDPDFFAQLIRWTFRPRGNVQEATPEKTLDEEAQTRARQAYDLLSSCRVVPGTCEDGTCDSSTLKTWVDRARKLCADSGHTDIADQEIGKVLSWSAADSDGLWPIRAVRETIERLESRHLEIGLQIGIQNGRGVTSRGLLDGGGQERELSRLYREWADQTATNWPRTSALLRSISKEYEWEGRREDDSSERWDVRG